MELQGAVAVVTGGASGFGAHVCTTLSGRGARVVIADHDPVAAGRLAAELPGAALVVPTDVAVDDDLVGLIERASGFGPLRLVVNNAGGWMSEGQFPDAPVEHWDATLRVNLWAAMRLTQLALPAIVAAGGGAVVNVASSAARGSEPYDCPEYAVAKAGMIRFRRPPAESGRRERCGSPRSSPGGSGCRGPFRSTRR